MYDPVLHGPCTLDGIERQRTLHVSTMNTVLGKTATALYDFNKVCAACSTLNWACRMLCRLLSFGHVVHLHFSFLFFF